MDNENRDPAARYRHELKYPITQAQLAQLRSRVKGWLPIDPHALPGGSYRIRSLYFDDEENTCFLENQNGTDPREKFRIRIYDHAPDHISLECKRKERGKTLKTACPLTREQTRALMAGRPLGDIAGQPPLLRRLMLQMLTRRLRPVVIVEYDRTPYVYPGGNVRVTLDTGLTASAAVGAFLEETLPARRPVMPPGMELLEVKYDAYLPDFIYRSLQLENLQQTAFSKFYLCRKFTL